MKPSTVRIVVCPSCKGPSPYGPDNAYRPFCSDRCKNIDLGAWANEEFALPAHPEVEGDDGVAHVGSGPAKPPSH